MDLHYVIIALFLSVILSVSTLTVIYSKRNYPTVKYLIACLIALIIWSLFDALHHLSNTVFYKMLWVKLEYFAICMSPVLYMLIAISYTFPNFKIRRRHILFLSVFPIGISILMLTNDYHFLVYKSYYLKPIDLHHSLLVKESGIFYYINVIYSYLAMFIGGAILIYGLIKYKKIFKYQFLLIFTSLIVPWLANINYIIGLKQDIDLTPVAFSYSLIAITFGIYRFKLFDIVPLAKEQIVELLNDAIIVIDEKNNIEYINKRAVKLMTPDTQKKIISNFEDHKEIEIDGEYYEINISKIQNANIDKGQIISLRNITEKKKYILDLLKAKKEAEKANQTKSNFIANVSHELKTPLTGILGLSEIILEEKNEIKCKEYAQAIKYSSIILNNIISQILDYSKIEKGIVNVTNKEFNLYNFLTSNLNIFKFALIDKNNKLEINYKLPKNIVCFNDELKIRQIINNIISNAVKFTKNGLIRIDVSSEDVVELNRSISVKISISDTGIGIPNDRLKDIFKSFTQVDESINRLYGGTGLGLAIAKYLTKMLNGEIIVKSEINKGSTFTVVLPLHIVAYDKTKGAEKNEAVVDVKFNNIRALIVEDNAFNIMIFANHLKSLGCEVIEKTDATAAIEFINNNMVDIIFLDIQMPNINGFQAITMMREVNNYYYKVPIVAVTAGIFGLNENKFVELSFNNVLKKPFSKSKLIDVISIYFNPTIINDNIEDKKLFNKERLLDRIENDYELYNKLVSSFHAQFKDLFDKLNNAIQNKNYAIIKHTAHTIKGMCLNMEIEKIAQLARNIEETAETDRDLNIIIINKEEIETLYEKVKSEIVILPIE